MSQVLKAFMGIFFMSILVLLGTGIIAAQVDVSDALDYKTDIITQLENSNFNKDVINACIVQAIENGYEIEVKTYAPGKQTAVYTTPDVTDTKDVVMAEVKISYPYQIGVFSSAIKHQVRGFAR